MAWVGRLERWRLGIGGDWVLETGGAGVAPYAPMRRGHGLGRGAGALETGDWVLETPGGGWWLCSLGDSAAWVIQQPW